MLAVLKATIDNRSGRDISLTVYSQMEIAKRKDLDDLERDWLHVVRSIYVPAHASPHQLYFSRSLTNVRQR